MWITTKHPYFHLTYLPNRLTLHSCLLLGKKLLVPPFIRNKDCIIVTNYQPISLTSSIVKIMESIIQDKIQEHMITNNLFTPNQYGFTVENLVLLSCLLLSTSGLNLLRVTV